MKLTSSLSALVSVLPTILAAQAYIPYARYGGDPSTDRVINAVDGRFYVGRQTTFIPPPWGLDNPETYNHTIITGPTGDNRWWMGVLQQGGQAIYLSYGIPEYAKASTNGTEGGIISANADVFQFRTEDLGGGVVKLVNVEAKGEGSVAPTVDWSACQSGDDDYAVYSGGLLRCHAFEMVLKVTDAAAPQYYHYWDE
ncbi:hypothetical protein D6D29_04081 [Aureobasidium pullulans]|nr:hypothetical protein D6D29_04081 [Aureobasidium pullulans]